MRFRRWLAPLVVALGTAAAFLPTLGGLFLNWEDDVNLVNNPAFRGLAWENIRWMFTTTHTGHWIPLTWLSFGVDYSLWGMNPYGYHLTNLLLHVAAATLFYFVALRLLRAAASDANEDTLRIGAAAAALFFAINPLRVESVAWVTERRDVLSMLWVQVTLLAYLKAQAEERLRGRWLAVSVVAFAFAIMSKSIVVTLPVVLIVLDLYLHRRAWLEKVPYFVLALAGGIMSAWAQRSAIETLGMRSLLSRVAVACYGLMFYLVKTLFPFVVSPLYEIPAEVSPFAKPMVVSMVAVAAITILLIRLRKKWSAGLAVWLSSIVLLAPVSGLVQAGPQIVAARYSYLPALGWGLLFGSAAVFLARRSRPAVAVLALWLVGLGALTWRLSWVWRDSESLWTYALRQDNESPIAHSNLSVILIQQGRYAEAHEHLDAAIRLNPEYEQAHANLAALLAREDRFEEAGEVRARLGYLLIKHGRIDRAVQLFREEVMLRPNDPAMHNNLGAALYARGEVAAAIQEFEAALRINPGDEKAKKNLDAARAGQAP